MGLPYFQTDKRIKRLFDTKVTHTHLLEDEHAGRPALVAALQGYSSPPRCGAVPLIAWELISDSPMVLLVLGDLCLELHSVICQFLLLSIYIN